MGGGVNKETAAAIIDDLVTDVAGVVRDQPRRELCVWWRGRLSGVVDTVKAVADDIDLQHGDQALNALREAEEQATEREAEKARDDLAEAFKEYAYQDVEGALQMITGLFVGLNIAFVEVRGEAGAGQKQIVIKGGEGQRTITIHAA